MHLLQRIRDFHLVSKSFNHFTLSSRFKNVSSAYFSTILRYFNAAAETVCFAIVSTIHESLFVQFRALRLEDHVLRREKARSKWRIGLNSLII